MAASSRKKTSSPSAKKPRGDSRAPTAKQSTTHSRPYPAEEEAKNSSSNEDDRSEDDLEQLEETEVIEVTGELVDDQVGTEFDAPPLPVRTEEHALARLDALQVYMQQIQRHPLLSHKEEKELTERYHSNPSVQDAARLVTANLRLVVKLAYEYRRACRNVMDLIQEGNIGLMQAVKRFDPYRGVKLSSYAAYWIRAYMLRYILNNWRLVKLGTTQAQRKLFFNLNREKARLTALGIEPTHGEIAHNLGVEEKEVVEMDRRLSAGDASLDATVGDTEGRPTTRMDLLPARNPGPDHLMEEAQLQDIVKQRLDDFKQNLTGKDLIIFDRRLVAEEPLTLQELGEEFGVSRERVRQLEARLTGKLRSYLAETLGDAVVIRE